MLHVALVHCLTACTLASAAPATDYFAIHVLDDQTGRGVPLVELRMVDGTIYVIDSQGCVAFREPGLMDQDVYFYVRSHGYEFPADGFGFRGKTLRIRPGESVELKLRRVNVALAAVSSHRR